MTQQIYNSRVLSEVYHLSVPDINDIILSQGKLLFSLEENSFVAYVPLFEKCVRYEKEFASLKEKISPADFSLGLEGTVLVVSSDSEYASAFLMLENMEALLEEYMDVTDDTVLLFSTNSKVPLFFGHREVIARFEDDYDQTEGSVLVKDFLDWRAKHV